MSRSHERSGWPARRQHRSTAQGRLLTPAMLALALVIPAAPAMAGGWSWPALVAAFEARGFGVSTVHPRCTERDLYGLYLRGSRRIVVCPRGDRSGTLLHEGWHAVQSRCLRGRPLLGADVLQRSLSRSDRRDLTRLYDGRRWQSEAEARLMASQTPARYFAVVDSVCRVSPQPLPVPPASPLQAAPSRGPS